MKTLAWPQTDSHAPSVPQSMSIPVLLSKYEWYASSGHADGMSGLKFSKASDDIIVRTPFEGG